MSETFLPELPQELWRAGKLELAYGVRQFLRVMRMASAGLGQLLAEVESRGVKDLYGYGSTVAWFADVAGLSSREAGPVVRRAIALNPTRALDGTEVPPVAPAAAAAAAEGAIGDHRIDQILEFLGKIPAEVSPEDREYAEKTLATLARKAGPRELADAEAQVLGWLDPDGKEPKDPEPAPPSREVTLERRKDGFWKLSGLLDDELGARTAAVLDAYAKPRPVDEVGQADPRSKAERQGDAFAEVLDLAIACPDQPGTSGYRTLLHVTIGLEELKSGIGTACLDFVGALTAREARLAACDCLMLPIVLSAAGEPLDVGRLRRFVTPGQRRALNIRDRGCAFPGCHRQPKHCHAHHIDHWADGGPTDLRNLVLLCGFHHRLIHHGDWEVRMAADGLPEFTPPQYLDPLRRPRRDTLHRAA
ncbi:HNH endonuclease signature motif containing protein [Amycolatopsis regifaucium]|uniref:HNH endonuclease signature motif containing protein n=1 Tax=Amycolatopsis regifaucium TaxID=546365 RepID=UPI0008F6909C|nr:HNH endonuclease signature motif containing protein [Amycolatopsis regifaucium]SFJ21766.1 HNH endonuclease [Amycolatopsis regifaucium]